MIKGDKGKSILKVLTLKLFHILLYIKLLLSSLNHKVKKKNVPEEMLSKLLMTYVPLLSKKILGNICEKLQEQFS